MDVLWGVLYLGIVSSLLPLCGIYASYVQDAEGKGLLPHVLWYVHTLVQLLSSIFSSGRLSALLVPATLFGLFQLCDETISPKLRIFWGAGHGFAHVVAALSCLMFVEFVTEWSIDVSLVSIDPVKNETLASSMYGEYEANFAKVRVCEERSDELKRLVYPAAAKLYAVINNTNAPSIATRFARRRSSTLFPRSLISSATPQTSPRSPSST